MRLISVEKRHFSGIYTCINCRAKFEMDEEDLTVQWVDNKDQRGEVESQTPMVICPNFDCRKYTPVKVTIEYATV